MKRLLLCCALALVGCTQAEPGNDQENLGGSCPGDAKEADGVAEYFVDFGPVLLGSEQSALLVLKNTANEPLVLEAEISPPFRLASETIEVLPNGETTLEFLFDPIEEGQVEGLAVLSDGCREIEIELSATAFAGDYECDAEAVDFGEVVVGTTGRQTITCTNRAELEMRLGLDQCDDCEEFSIDPAIAEFDGLLIPGGGTASFDVVFEPRDDGQVFGYVVLSAGEEMRHLELKGTGVAEAPVD